MSRSVTVAVAYIMSVTNLSWKEALKVVRVGRSVANPNLGFQKQLQEFEACRLVDERRRLKERYPSLALIDLDEEQCRVSLLSYQSLLLSKDICEGNCAIGETCPTGMCRSPSIKRQVLPGNIILVLIRLCSNEGNLICILSAVKVKFNHLLKRFSRLKLTYSACSKSFIFRIFYI